MVIDKANGGKADALAECAVYAGDPGCFRESLRIIDTATAAELDERQNPK